MAEMQLVLNEEEQRVLVDLLTSASKQHLVEEHRTRTPVYRAHIEHEEKLIEGILAKLNRVPQAV